MVLRCPKCKSDDLKKIRRSKYLLRAGLCLAAIVACCIVFQNLLEDDNDSDISIGIVIIAILAVAILATGIYLVIKAIRTKETTYYCGYCESNIGAPLQITAPKEFDTMAQISRHD
jgi:hypothetical protein